MCTRETNHLFELACRGGNVGVTFLDSRSSEEPDADVAWNNLAVTHIRKAANGTKLSLNVLLVLENVGFPSEHRVARLVVRANIHDSKSSSLSEESADLPENAVSAKEGDFMESIPGNTTIGLKCER